MRRTLPLFVLTLLCFSLNSQNLVTGIQTNPSTVEFCEELNESVELSAEVFQPNQVGNSYTVSSIPFTSVEVSEPIVLPKDDEYSQVVNIPFPFCYFGNESSQLVVGANGNISFDVSLAGQQYPPLFSASVPSPDLPSGGIFGALHDIDPSIGGTVTYGIVGEEPFRAMVISFQEVPHFTCVDIFTSQQIVLHETSNFIDMYIGNKPVCAEWNDGNAVIGIQNIGGTIGFTPPNRNTSDSPWTATEEAWRFVPEGPPVPFDFTWQDSVGNIIGTSIDITVTPVARVDTFYTATATYNLSCPTESKATSAEVSIVYDRIPLSVPSLFEACEDESVTIDTGLSSGDGFTFTWFFNNVEIPDETGPALTVTEAGSYQVSVDLESCNGFASTEVVFRESPIVDLGGDRSFCADDVESYPIDATPSNIDVSEVTFSWFQNGVLLDETEPILTVTESGVYSVTVSPVICPTQASVEILFEGVTPQVPLAPNTVVCDDTSSILDATPSNISVTDVSFEWTLNGEVIEGETGATLTVTEPSTYGVTVTDGICSSSFTTDVTFSESPQIDIGGASNACAEVGSLDLDATPTNVDVGDITFTWSKDGEMLTETGPVLTVTEDGIYTVNAVFGDCSSQDSVGITFGGAVPEVTLPSSTGLCDEVSYTIDATPFNIDVDDVSFVWSKDGTIIPDDTDAMLTVTESGTYEVLVSDAFSCSSVTTTTVTFNDSAVIPLESVTEVCATEAFTLDASPTNYDPNELSYSWFKDGGEIVGANEATLTITPTSGVNAEGIYRVRAVIGACETISTTEVRFFGTNPGCNVPQGISPNNDLINDCFDLSFLSTTIGIDRVDIFNRYGTKIFSMRDYTDEWCGQSESGGDVLPVGTYFYLISLSDQTTRSGWVYLNK